jgi:DnaK suppressor protein
MSFKKYGGIMDESFLRSIAERLQRDRRALIDELSRRKDQSENFGGDLQPELEEHAQTEVASGITEALEERQQDRLGNIDEALERIEAGTYGECQSCGRPIGEERLEANPTTTFCSDCASEEEADAAGQAEETAEEIPPARGPLPPDLELMDDQELQDHLRDLVSEDGQVDMHELQIIARNGVIYLEGALPSEPEHAILLNILTDVAGVQEIVDQLEIERLAWERDDRWKEEETQDVLPGTIPKQEPYGGTDDVVLADEEGVSYEPPENPPAPPHRKD